MPTATPLALETPPSSEQTIAPSDLRATAAASPRIAALTTLKRLIDRANLEDRDTFREVMVGAYELLGYTDASVAETFSCTRMTANRWIRGEAAPFAGMRLVIFKLLAKDVDRYLRTLRT